jgi:hypothetical protein
MRLVFLLLLLMPFLIFAQDHLLITEIQTVPSDSSFIEIYNPTLNAFPLDNVYLADHNTYYRVVENVFTNNSQDFIVKFPNAASVASKSAIVIALNGAAFEAKFGVAPDYEILGTSAAVPDMPGLFVGASAQFNTQEMLILFQWDGNSDLVQDIDYVAWGLFTSTFVDKSGIRIDGPDSGSDSTQYLADTPVISQSALASLTNDTQSIQRIGISEGNETQSGGNGLTGHDETSEDLSNQFALANPTPGVVQEVPGDGSGLVSVSPDSIQISSTATFQFTFTGENTFILDKVQITIPANWTWSGLVGDVSISGTGFTGSSISLNGNDILIENTNVTTTETGIITFQNLTAPAQRETSVFTAKTAVAGGNLSEIQNSPSVAVWTVITIADIQNDPGLIGSVVSLEAIVTLGSGIAATDWTDAYIQDNSGRGINVYKSGTPVDPDLVRGNRIRITGSVDEFGGVTEIVNYTLQILATGQSLPSPLELTTAAANDITYEGTFVEIKGFISDKFVAGGGTTFRINDGSGEVVIRAWDSAGLSLSSFNINDTISVKGIMDVYNSNSQILLSYQDDIDFTTLEIAGDGSGEVTVMPDSVSTNELVSLEFSITGTSLDTVSVIEITIPDEWNWTGNNNDVSTSGFSFSTANISVNGKTINVSNALLENNVQGSITISNLTSPAVDTVSQFTIKTGNAARVSEIENPPIILVGAGTQVATIPISLIQTDSTWVGKTVTIRGVISIGSGILRTDYTDSYIQDSSGYGLNVFSFDPPDPDIVKGNLVVLTGLIEEYQGITEITNYSLRVLGKNIDIPGIKNITTLAATDGSFEGSYVKVSGTVIDNYSAGGGSNVIIDDGSGEVTLRIWDTAQLDLSSFNIGDGIVAYGVVDLYQNIGQVLVGYQEDIQHIVLPRVPQFLTLPNKPFVPDRGEILVIRYSAGGEDTQTTMRIYDLSGRLVTTLLDGTGRSFEQQIEWNGTDQLNDLVPLGTYILHYEVVNNTTGKKWQKAAPIVIGTVLK